MRFVIIFSKSPVSLSEAANILGYPQSKVIDGTDALESQSDNRGKVLHFPEFGICYLSTNSKHAEKLRRIDGIKHVVHRPPPRRRFNLRTISNQMFSEATELPDHLKQIRVPEAWASFPGRGEGIKVGIVDSGIDLNHPNLAPVERGANFHPLATDTDDKSGHGTSVAGIVGARGNSSVAIGVAPKCRLYPLKVSYRNDIRWEYLVAAMCWSLRHGLDVLNVSIAQYPFATRDEIPFVEFSRASSILEKNNIVVVGVSGNSGDENNHFVTSPARAKGIITVGGVRSDNQWYGDSAYGPKSLKITQGVEVVAPAVNVVTTRIRGDITAERGTSYAAPQVTGAVALLRQKYPGFSAREIRMRLWQTAKDLTPKGRDTKTGWGLLDCGAAISATTRPTDLARIVKGTVKNVSRFDDFMILEFRKGARISRWDAKTTTCQQSSFVVARHDVISIDSRIIVHSIGQKLEIAGLLEPFLNFGLCGLQATSIVKLRISS